MLDIKFLRSNPDVVKQNIKNKFQDEKLPLVDEVIELDKRNREIKQEVEALRAEKNKASKEIGAMMAQKKIEEERNSTSAMSLDDLFSQMKSGEVVDLNIIVKADVNGTAEAVKSSLEKINVEGARVNVIRSTVGAISESDILLASASKAIIYGFNVRPDANVRRKADEEGVEIRLHQVIYKMVEEIEAAMKGMWDPEFEEKVIGTVEVRQTFKVSGVGTIAGGYVLTGKVERNAGVRVIRDDVVIHQGELASLKRFKDDVKEVAKGYECGLQIANYNDIKEGDIIEVYVMEEIKR